MAGSQFSFFLGADDQFPFEEILRQSGSIAFLKEWPLSPIAEELQHSVVSAFGEEKLGILIARREDVEKIEFTPIETRQEYSCDISSALVVEFSRCYVTDRFIRAGRLYRNDKYWGYDGKLVAKPSDFIEWGMELYRLAKKSLTKVQQGCYAGEEAMKLRMEGVAFEGLDIPIGSVTG